MAACHLSRPGKYRPRRLVVMTSYANLTHEVINRTGIMAINLIRADKREWLPHWGYQSGPRYRQVRRCRMVPGREWVLAQAAGHIEGNVINTMDGGDHAIRLVAPTVGQLKRPEVATISMIDALARGWEEPNAAPPPHR